MRRTVSRTVALVIAITYIVLALTIEKTVSFAATVAAGAVLPLALIWFPDLFGGLTGWGTRAPIDRPSPPVFVSFMGWFLLVGLPFLMLLFLGK
jgi:hypothetical protein